uniref:Uncharacterized protein n=1 Tax=Pyricularia oryzae (strain P131) TaxID=1143193 RepID=L7JEX5_PYRO1
MAEGQGGLEHSILPAAGKWGAIGFGQLYPALGTLSTYSLAQLPTQRRTYLLKSLAIFSCCCCSGKWVSPQQMRVHSTRFGVVVQLEADYMLDL